MVMQQLSHTDNQSEDVRKWKKKHGKFEKDYYNILISQKTRDKKLFVCEKDYPDRKKNYEVYIDTLNVNIVQNIKIVNTTNNTLNIQGRGVANKGINNTRSTSSTSHFARKVEMVGGDTGHFLGFDDTDLSRDEMRREDESKSRGMEIEREREKGEETPGKGGREEKGERNEKKKGKGEKEKEKREKERKEKERREKNRFLYKN